MCAADSRMLDRVHHTAVLAQSKVDLIKINFEPLHVQSATLKKVSIWITRSRLLDRCINSKMFLKILENFTMEVAFYGPKTEISG